MQRAVAWGVIATALVVFVALLFLAAPYGRHQRRFGPEVSARWGWVVMESPGVWMFAAVVFFAGGPMHPAALVLCAAWLLHYGERTAWFPFRVARPDQRSPLIIFVAGFTYNAVNAWLNASHVAAGVPAGWHVDPRFVAGLLVFVAGSVLNRASDATLIALRRGGYAIPRGAMFRFVSCPNYLGEIVAWCGWALASWSLAGASFAIFSAANLIPRALRHHRWYREKFPDYPTERRAVIPLLL